MHIDNQWIHINKLLNSDTLKDWDSFKVSPYF